MSRERAEIYRLGQKEKQTTQKAPTEIFNTTRISPRETIVKKPQKKSEKYGYISPVRQELHEKVTTIRQEDPQKMMQQAVELYGERIVSSIVAEGDPRNLKAWFDNPESYSLAGNQDRSLTKIAVSIDFAKEMREKGAEKAAIRKTFIERQPKLGDLSLSSALARMGPEEIGLIHEVSTAIASGETKLRTMADIQTAKRLAESYTLPYESRGH